LAQQDPGKFYKELFDLESRVAVVIGGTGVLCGEMAWGLLQAGTRVVLIGRNEKKAERHFQRWGSSAKEARFFKADVTKRNQIAQIIPQVLDWYGGNLSGQLYYWLQRERAALSQGPISW